MLARRVWHATWRAGRTRGALYAEADLGISGEEALAMMRSGFTMEGASCLAAGRLAAGLIAGFCGAPRESSAMDAGWDEMRAFENRMLEIESSLEENGITLATIGAMIPSGKYPELDAAREKKRNEQKACDAAVAGTPAEEKGKALRAARSASENAVVALMADCQGYRDLAAKCARLRDAIAVADAKKAKLSFDEVRELSRAKREYHGCEARLYGLRWAWLARSEVRPLYWKAEELQKSYDGEMSRNKAARDARARLRQAEKEVSETELRIAPETEMGRAAMEEKMKLFDRQEELRAKMEQARNRMAGGEWDSFTIASTGPRDRKGVPGEMTATMWVPPNCERVRGVFIIMWSRFLEDPYVRSAASQTGLALVRFEKFDGLFNYTGDAPECLDGALAKLAEASRHPEVKQAPFMSVGMSTTVIGARNLAYWRPARAIGVIHVAGGNMHHNVHDPKLTLAGVPFLAVNGEFEVFGPDGGIRGEYGRQTQWIMIREQLLRMRNGDPNHLMSLAVRPGGGHGGWDSGLSILAATFIVKAMERRVPRDAGRNGGPVECVRIEPESGWLADSDIDRPRHEPAPYGEYRGNRRETFWHFDGEMARAVERYHAEEHDKGRFVLPDTSKIHPVPSDWPPKQGRAGEQRP